MTNENPNTPVVKATHPELYTKHTFHMQRAKSFTYNYCIIDEVILELWNEMTIAQIAEVMNEYSERIAYRVQVLKTLGMIKGKNTGKTKLLLQERQLRVQLRKVQKQLDKIAV
tara:strand:- start:96 stop:434 length:339 start_codon:yes stop_codon:yes gene_type:complete